MGDVKLQPRTTPTPTTTTPPGADRPGKAGPSRPAGSSRATTRVALDRPAQAPASTRDAQDGADAVGSRVPDEVRKGVQAAGGVARGVALAGSGTAQSIARATKIGGKVPGAAVITGAFAAYDTYQSFRETGLSQQTVRTGAGGIGGVAGALKGGAIGASIGAIGGPVGAAIGGAAGAIIGGIAGSGIGQGVVDGFAAARDVIANAEIDSIDDVFTVGGRAAWEGAKAFGSTAGRAIADQVTNLGGSIADGAGWLWDRAGDAADAVADVAGDVADTVSDVASDVADTVSDVAGDVADTVSDVASDVADVAGDVLDSITPW